jgi:hypothetical protein
LAYGVNPYLYSRYIEQFGDEPSYVAGYRADPVGYWNQIAKICFGSTAPTAPLVAGYSGGRPSR